MASRIPSGIDLCLYVKGSPGAPNRKFVGVQDTSINRIEFPLCATFPDIDDRCIFRLIVHPDRPTSHRLFSMYRRDYCSAIGGGWLLFAQTRDFKWSFFKFAQTTSGYVTFRSTVRVAQVNPIVNAFGRRKVLRVMNRTPLDPWSFFELIRAPRPRSKGLTQLSLTDLN